MKKLFCFTLLIALLDFANAESAVWKISNGENSLYLGGSVHALRASDFPLPREFDKAFNASDMIVFEADLEAATKPEMAQKLLEFMMLPQGQTLKSVLADSTYKQLEAQCAKMGIPIEFLSQLTPFSAVNMLTVAQMQKMGLMAQGVDLYYLTEAKKAQKKVDFLESLEFQMSLLNAKEYQDELVLQALYDLNANVTQKVVGTIIDEWKSGVTTQTELMIVSMKMRFFNIYKKLFVDRNAAWIAKFEQYLKTKESEFVIVGFGHFVGSEGLLEQLKKRGYKVEQLKL